jgi:hypothetical protein
VRLASAGEPEPIVDAEIARPRGSFQDRLARGDIGRLKSAGCRRCGMRIEPWGVVRIEDDRSWRRWSIPAIVRGPARRRG